MPAKLASASGAPESRRAAQGFVGARDSALRQN
jgi:hypothetical protein